MALLPGIARALLRRPLMYERRSVRTRLGLRSLALRLPPPGKGYSFTRCKASMMSVFNVLIA